MGSYTSDELSAQMATNLGLQSRSSHGRDISRPHYSTSHGYEAVASGAFPTISSLEDDGDAEPRRKKVNRLSTQTHVSFGPDTLPSSKNHSVATSIFAIRVVARIPQNGERYAHYLDLFDWPLITLGCRVPMALKLFAMPVASDGQRRCANMRRPPRQVTRISFLSMTSYPLNLVATTPLVFYDMGHFLTGYSVVVVYVPLPSLLGHGATRAWFIGKTWILNSKRRGKTRGEGKMKM